MVFDSVPAGGTKIAFNGDTRMPEPLLCPRTGRRRVVAWAVDPRGLTTRSALSPIAGRGGIDDRWTPDLY